jgi:hypothetical protein
VTADFTYIRWLGDRKGIEMLTKVWDKTIIDRSSENAGMGEILQANSAPRSDDLRLCEQSLRRARAGAQWRCSSNSTGLQIASARPLSPGKQNFSPARKKGMRSKVQAESIARRKIETLAKSKPAPFTNPAKSAAPEKAGVQRGRVGFPAQG